MSSQPIRMLDDPSVPAHLRDLLQAGAQNVVTDYNYEQGLAQHIAHVAAGTPPPAWAADMLATAKTTAAAGLSLKAIAVGVSIPLATAGVVAAVVFGGGRAEKTEHRSFGSDTPAAVAPETELEPQMLEDGESAQFRRDQPKGSAVVARRSPNGARHADQAGAHKAAARSHAKHRERPLRAHPSVGAGALETTRPVPHVPMSPDRRSQFGQAGALRTTTAGEAVRSTSSAETESAERRNDLHARWARGEDRNRVEEKASPAKRQSPPPVRQEPQLESGLRLDPLQREMRMLAAAHRLLESDPERTLALATIGQRDFPKSSFSEERRYLIVMALIKLDRMDEARHLGLRFSRTYPHSPFSERIRRALALRAAQQ